MKNDILTPPAKPLHPCKDCMERAASCASSCEKWKRYTEERDANYVKRAQYRKARFTNSFDARMSEHWKDIQKYQNSAGEHGIH